MLKFLGQRSKMHRAFRSRAGITRFLALWLAAMLVAVVALGGGLLVATRKLNTLTDNLFADAVSLDRAHLFERAILAEGREDLLWRATADSTHARNKITYLQQADQLIGALQYNVSSGEEQDLVNEVTRRYRVFRALVFAETGQDVQATRGSPQNGKLGLERADRVRIALDGLLQTVEKHRALNTQQMQDTMRHSATARREIDRTSLLILSTATLLLLAGGVLLWLRIFVPTLRLAEAARAFGDGDLHARAEVVKNDEMGHLSNVFNTMAEAICERERERLDFVATVAHDLKNPLVIIGGAAHLMRGKTDRLSAEERDLWLGRISSNSRRLETMIADLMDDVQIQTGRLVLSRDEVDIAELTKNVVRDFSEVRAERTLHCECPEHACLLRGDRKRLERVLSNLVSNALKYSAQSDPVWVELAIRDNKACWIVRDEGAGIAPADLPRLFLPFSRLERTRHMASGTGMGLVSVKKIVEAHGGALDISSELDQGTTVTVHLPMQPDKK